MKKRRQRLTKPVIFVFCEGDTEKEYVELLRSHFRVPVQIITKVVGTKVCQKVVAAHLREYGYPDKDSVFLLYDGDRDDIMMKLDKVDDGLVLISMPCFEIWFMLHMKECRAEISSDHINKNLCAAFHDYKKGEIKGELKKVLIEKWGEACCNARMLPRRRNPSSEVYLLVEKIAKLADNEN